MARHDRNIVEEANLHQLYDIAVMTHKCGYYPVCANRDCQCGLNDPEIKKFDVRLWDHMADDYDQAVAEHHRQMGENDGGDYNGELF